MRSLRLLAGLASLATGCEAGITSDAQPLVSVLKHDGVCFALIAGDAIDPSLGVSGTCSYRGDTRLYAGVDRLEVIIDYGPDVPFSRSAAAPTPTVVVTVDGVASEEPIEISDEIRIGSRAYYIATLRAPRETSSDIRISAGVNAGFQTLVAEPMSTLAPSVSLSLLECNAGASCELAGGVGNAHISLLVTGAAEHQVRIESRLDGIPEPDPIPPVKTFIVGNNSEAITGVPIPAAPDDTSWTLTAHLGNAATAQVRAVIRAPEIVARLSCAESCTLASGDPVGLEIQAPGPIRPLEALVSTRLDGVPQLVSVRVALEQRGGTALGLLGLTAPAGSGNWQISVSVAGYVAPTIVTTVQ